MNSASREDSSWDGKYSELLLERLAMEAVEAHLEDAVAFSAHPYFLLALPFLQPEPCESWVRTYSTKTISIEPGMTLMPIGRPQSDAAGLVQGYPYGGLARQFFICLMTEAVLQQSSVVSLHKGLGPIFRRLDLTASGGKFGRLTAFNDQARRLLASKIQYRENDSAFEPVFTYDKAEALKSDDFGSQNKVRTRDAFSGTVTFSDEFFNQFLVDPLQLDLRCIRALRGSPFALDWYTWLAWKRSSAKNHGRCSLPWPDVARLFSSTQRPRRFRERFQEVCREVKLIYPEGNAILTRERLWVGYESSELVLKSPQVQNGIQPVRATCKLGQGRELGP